ncbi:DUF1508 domain-containing protein [uncultured Flavobacterium sp.]|uniref:DUF1508 domain-containing protein n=1 Tax=uncultured Flavobacterium sp. TaxID=165435 RepID=UPI0030CA4E96|tara:strand:+ start:20 stop:379 length:360 start_codon:yes stop_codon:yes gene_type:complete
MGTFVISKRINGTYKYEYVSRKGKSIFISANFDLRFECENEINLLKKEIANCFFMKCKSSRGKFYFKIVIHEREIATSRKFSTELMMVKSINEILTFINLSEILDFSLELDFFKESNNL